VFYLPADSKQIYGYSGGNKNYGGTQKITGERSYENPFFVRGGTGGSSPEKAYKSLFGPKALKSLQNDVTRGMGGYINYAYGFSNSANLGRVQEFIENTRQAN
jgi:hypothetical protein